MKLKPTNEDAAIKLRGCVVPPLAVGLATAEEQKGGLLAVEIQLSFLSEQRSVKFEMVSEERFRLPIKRTSPPVIMLVSCVHYFPVF